MRDEAMDGIGRIQSGTEAEQLPRQAALVFEPNQSPVIILAERQGFEPWERVSVHLISSQAHSASLAPLHNYYFSTDDASRPI